MAYWSTVLRKRSVDDVPCDSHKGPASGRQPKAADDESPGLDCDSSASAPAPKSLMKLPAELRVHICGPLFMDLVATPQHPYDEYPPNHRFQDYANLLRTCRQVYDEAQSLFRKEYAHRIVFYYEESSALIERVKYWKYQSIDAGLSNARFCLRARRYVNGVQHPRFFVNNSCVMLMAEQARHDYRYVDFIEQFGQASMGGRWLSELESDGVKRLMMNHETCHGPSNEDCLVCTEMVLPPFAHNNCSAACYKWSPLGSEGPEASIVLEGKLSDLTIEAFSVELARVRLAHYHWLITYQGKLDSGRVADGL